MPTVVILTVIVAVTSLIGWIAYLIFLSKLKPKHYKKAAVAVRAFRFSGFAYLGKAIVKALAYLKAKAREKPKDDSSV